MNLNADMDKMAKQALVDEFDKRGQVSVYSYDKETDSMKAVLLTPHNIEEHKGKDVVNAWKHAYLSAFLDKNLNSGISKFLGYLKELISINHDSRSALKDLYNNGKGLEASKSSRTLDEAASKIFEMIYDVDAENYMITEKQNPELVIHEDDKRLDEKSCHHIQSAIDNIKKQIPSAELESNK